MNNSEPSKTQELDPKALKGRKGARTSVRARLTQPGYIKAAHSGKTEAVVKVASYAQGFRAKGLLMYVARADKPGQEIEVEDQDGRTYKGKEDIEKIYQEWQKNFDHRKRGPIPDNVKVRGDKKVYERRHATHIILSAVADPTEENNKKVMAAARAVFEKHFRDRGFDYVHALHKDSGKAHVHIVVQNANREKGGPKLRLNPPDLHELRADFAARLSVLQMEHVATLRRDRPHIIEQVQKGIEGLYKRETQFQRAMARETPSRDAFAYRRAVNRSLTRLREQVKKETLPLTERRQELLGGIRRLERELTKRQPEIGKEIAATVRKFGKDAQNYKKWLNELTAPRKDQEKSLKEQGQRWRTLEEMQKKTALEIREARQEIELAPIPQEEKKAALDALTIHEKAIKGRSPVELQVQQLVEKIGKTVERYGKQAKENRHPVTDRRPTTEREKLAHRQALDKAGQGLEKQIVQASKTIKQTSGLDFKQQQAALQQLQQCQRSIQNTREKGSGLGLAR